jgi:archaellum biogenesis ATPase FlaH
MSAEASALERCNSGISGLDHILGGGFPAAALYLIQGNPGLGKTTPGDAFPVGRFPQRGILPLRHIF